uniref:CATSPERG C-terminal domain-containing protein n=4 Tax=Clytia hemisphaerica TaxID=252671 RepID=A0A7M5VCE2_9CNID
VDVSATDNICKDVTLNAQLVLINDTLIINSKYGLIQMRQYMTGTLLMGGDCFSKIITVNDELALAISSQRTKLISLYKGSTCSDEICQMNSSFSVWLNETLRIQDYEIVDISTSQYHNKVFILLHKFNLTRSAVVKTMLLEMNLASGNGSHSWQFRLLNSDLQCSPNRLHISALFHFFVFGSDSCLLYSSNFGISFAQVTYDNTIVSSIHTNSKNGLFIFRTSENEVWLSQVGFFHAQKFVLSYKEGQRHVGFLFDSENSLTEFVFNSSPKCLQKRQLNIKEIIKRTQQLSYLPSTKKQGCAYRGKCKETVFKRTSMFPKNTKCLYDSTILRLANSKYYSRIKMVHHKDQKRLLPKKWRNLLEVTSSDLWIEITDLVEHAHELLVYDNYPDKISLDRGQCAHFELMVYLQSNTDQAGWIIEDISLHFQSTSSKDINIQSEKIIDYIDNSVNFKVKFCDSGIQRQVQPPGYTHVSNHVVLQVQPSPSECIGSRYVQTTIPLQVDHGCPSSRRINIDYQRTKENVNHFCDEEYCFHFEKIFDAYLTITDDATQEIKRFLGKKNLTFIGGGPEANQIRPFTEQEIRDYNMELGSRSKLIWAISENAYSWLCGSASPCGGIAPVFPSSPYYYLNLRFNNSDTDTNCDYSFEFLIKIHGMPPDGIYPSMFVVFLCLGIMGTVVVGAYFLQGKYTPITSLLHQWRNRAGKLFHQNIIYRKNKIDIKDSIVKVNEWIEMNRKDGSSSDTQVMEKGTSMASLTVESQSGQDQEGLEQSENTEGQDSTSQEDVLQQDQHQDARLRRKLTV